jgi:hypothetical protein
MPDARTTCQQARVLIALHRLGYRAGGGPEGPAFGTRFTPRALCLLAPIVVIIASYAAYLSVHTESLRLAQPGGFSNAKQHQTRTLLV